jgi:hypothetical protein
MDWSAWEQGTWASSCEICQEPSNSAKYSKFLTKLSAVRLSTESIPCIQFICLKRGPNSGWNRFTESSSLCWIPECIFHVIKSDIAPSFIPAVARYHCPFLEATSHSPERPFEIRFPPFASNIRELSPFKFGGLRINFHQTLCPTLWILNFILIVS